MIKKLRARFRQPKWRHGKLNAVLMLGFIAICVLLNVGVKVLEDEYGWRRDFSFNGYATTTGETAEMLNGLEYTVELYLLYQSGSMDERLLQVLNRYAVLSDKVSVLPTDIAKDPGVLTRFQGDLDTALEADSVVVSCETTGRYKILSYDDFFTQGYSIDNERFEIEGLAYEKKLSEAIVYVSRAKIPTLGLLEGHGELTEAAMTHLISFLNSNNYDCKTVSLTGGDTLDGVDLLLIAGPQKDLSDSELDTIAAFAREGGSLWVLRDYTDPLDTLPNYLSLLKSYGVTPLSGVVVAGEEDEGSYYGEPIYLLPYMCELDMTLPLIVGNCDTLLLVGASAFETPGEPDQSLSVGTVLKSGPNAYLRNVYDGLNTLEKQEGDRVGEMSLAVYAHRMHANGNVSRLLAIGNSALFTDEFMYQSTFNQEFIIQVMGELLPQVSISLDIMASAAFRPALTVGSQTLGVALLVAVPALIVIAALFVLLPRRNR